MFLSLAILLWIFGYQRWNSTKPLQHFFGDRVLISIGLSGGGFFGGKNIHPTLNVFDIVLAGFTMSTDEMLTFFISSSSVLRHRLTLLVTTPTM